MYFVNNITISFYNVSQINILCLQEDLLASDDMFVEYFNLFLALPVSLLFRVLLFLVEMCLAADYVTYCKQNRLQYDMGSPS